MKFIPFGHLVLVEKLDIKEEVKEKLGLYMPETHEGRFWKVQIIAKGESAASELNVEDICMANPLPLIDKEKAFDNPNYCLMMDHDLLGRWES